jgi:hypothetical protein
VKRACFLSQGRVQFDAGDRLGEVMFEQNQGKVLSLIIISHTLQDSNFNWAGGRTFSHTGARGANSFVI